VTRTIIVFETDKHAGHKHGLLNPDSVISREDQEGELYYEKVSLTAIQQYLWELGSENKKKANKLASKSNIVYFDLGDQTQGKAHPAELVSTNALDQVGFAIDNLKPWLENSKVKSVRLVKGTASHEFGNGGTPALVQKALRDQYKKRDIKTVWHGLATIGGLEVDYSHHGPFPGSRDWLKGNVARYYLRDRMYIDIRSRGKPAGIYARGHYHTEIVEMLRMKVEGIWYTSWLLLVPSMCFPGAYARKVTRSVPRITNGLFAVEVVDGKVLDIFQYTKTADLRTKEIL
jgi:hypothetical protein